MIRFRVGHSWKREPTGREGPRDAFALELEGINLLPGANDEPLVRIVGGLVDTVAGLVADGERAGQVSLEDVHLELCLWRTGGADVEVSVIDLAQPPRQLHAPVLVELPALVEAVTRCARAFLRDVAATGAGIAAEVVALERGLKRLGAAAIGELPARTPAPWSAVRGAEDGLGFSLQDRSGRALSWGRRTRAGLPPLLLDGALTLPDGARQEGLPFLGMMGLVRAANQDTARLAGQPLRAADVFRAGLELCLALRSRNPALAGNPYVEALHVRCTDGLTALRQPVPDKTEATVSAPRASPGAPLAQVGEVRRVGLQPRWSRPVALGEDGGRIALGRRWVVVHAPHALHAFTRAGASAFRHLASRGVAASPVGLVLCATPERVTCFEGAAPQARWLRDHDEGQLGPSLFALGEVLVCPIGKRCLVAFARLTGRELWRFEPPRTQVLSFTVVGTRVVAGTDDGTLYGLDAADGQVRFRVKADLPVCGPPVPVRHRALVVLNRGEHTAVYLCDALSKGATTPAGALSWTRELILATPCRPVSARGRSWIGGARDGRAVVACLGPRGQLLWERTLACDARSLTLLPFEGGVIATDARGAATRLLPDGSAEWVLGSPGDELGRPIAPVLRRQVLVIPGPVTRLVQPRGGRVLAELATGARMLDLAADARLTLFVLREPGTLETFVPGAALAVVRSPR